MGPRFRIRLLDADRVRERSSGALEAGEGLDPDQHEWRHLELACALPHPWFDDQLARALGLSPRALARPEPRGWLEDAVEAFDVGAALASERESARADEARLELLAHLQRARTDLRAWLIRAVLIPPTRERRGLDGAYAGLLAANEACVEAWSPASQQSLAAALAELLRARAGPHDRLALEAWAPHAFRAPVICDPELDYTQISIPIWANRILAGEPCALVSVRGAPCYDSLLTLMPRLRGDRGHYVGVSPLLCAALAERTELDAADLSLVVGRPDEGMSGYTLDMLDPAATLFARPFFDMVLAPRSVWTAVRAPLLDHEEGVGVELDFEGDTELWTLSGAHHALEWIADLDRRRLRLARLERLLGACVAHSTRVGSSLQFDDLRVEGLEPHDIRADEDRRLFQDQYDDGLITEDERVLKIEDARANRNATLHYSLRDNPAQPSSPWVRAAWSRHRPPPWLFELVCGAMARSAPMQLPRRGPLEGLDAFGFAAIAPSIRRRAYLPRVHRAEREAVMRQAFVAMREPPESPDARDDCGNFNRSAALNELSAFHLSGQLRSDLGFLPPEGARPTEPCGILACRHDWVCRSCWRTPTGFGLELDPSRAGLELARLFGAQWWPWHGGVPARYGERPWLTPQNPRTLHAFDALVAGCHENSALLPGAHAEISTTSEDRVLELPFGTQAWVRELSGDEVVLEMRQGRLGLASYRREGGIEVDRDRHELVWVDARGVTQRRAIPPGWVLQTSAHGLRELVWDPHWEGRAHEWEALLGRRVDPPEVLAPLGGKLRIETLAEDLVELHIRSPHGTWSTRVDQATAGRFRAVDGDIVGRSTRLLAGQVDPREAAPLNPNALGWWVLDVLLDLQHLVRTAVDPRAIELYAHLATTPRNSFHPLDQLVRERGDLLGRLRAGSLLEALRAAVTSGCIETFDLPAP